MKLHIEVRSIADFPETEIPTAEPPAGTDGEYTIYDLFGASLGHFPTDIDPNEYVRRLREGDD